jgi:cellobiose phosphorylase
MLSGALYHIEVSNPENKTGPNVKIVVDGTPIEGNLIPRAPKGTKVKVEVTII